MKLGIIVPTTGSNPDEDFSTIESAHKAASGMDHEVVVVYDGWDLDDMPPPYAIPSEVGITLPRRAGDAGATPRGVGSAYAIGQHCDVISFLDSGNAFEPTHLANAVVAIQQGAEVVSSLRVMVSHTGETMYVDTFDSDGVGFCDTNCMVLAGRAAKFATTWNWNVSASGADRKLWERLCHSFRGHMECTGQPTVRYVTRWACHYNARNEDGTPKFIAPDPAKWPILSSDGANRAAMLATPLWDHQRGWIADLATATVNGERICVDVPKEEVSGT